jgi:hypothetical protein
VSVQVSLDGGIPAKTVLASGLTGSSYEVPIAVHESQWPAISYLVEACSAVCLSSNVVPALPAMIGSIGYFKASDADPVDWFGSAVSVSGDGKTLAVGAPGQDDNVIFNSGAVYIFVRTGNTWTQEAILKTPVISNGGAFGSSVSLSADGNTLAAGAPYDDLLLDGGLITNAGAAYVFTRSLGVWTQQTKLKATNAAVEDFFGNAISISANGGRVAIGAWYQDGIAVPSPDAGSANAGAVYVFTRISQTWVQEAFLKASNAGADDYFGFSLSLSGDGNSLVVGAYNEDSIISNPADNSLGNSGAAYVFDGTSGWVQRVILKAPNADIADQFGYAVSTNGLGDTIVIGAPIERSNARGVNGNQSDNSSGASGAAYVFQKTAGSWTQQTPTYLKASHNGDLDQFGHSVAISSLGTKIAVGAYYERSASAGINGNDADRSAVAAGAVYTFKRDPTVWVPGFYVKASNPEANDWFGETLSMSANGDTLAVGAHQEDGAARGINGSQANGSDASGAVYLY